MGVGEAYDGSDFLRKHPLYRYVCRMSLVAWFGALGEVGESSTSFMCAGCT